MPFLLGLGCLLSAYALPLVVSILIVFQRPEFVIIALSSSLFFLVGLLFASILVFILAFVKESDFLLLLVGSFCFEVARYFFFYFYRKTSVLIVNAVHELNESILKERKQKISKKKKEKEHDEETYASKMNSKNNTDFDTDSILGSGKEGKKSSDISSSSSSTSALKLKTDENVEGKTKEQDENNLKITTTKEKSKLRPFLILNSITSSLVAGIGYSFMHSLIMTGPSILESFSTPNIPFSESCPAIPKILLEILMSIPIVIMDICLMFLAFEYFGEGDGSSSKLKNDHGLNVSGYPHDDRRLLSPGKSSIYDEESILRLENTSVNSSDIVSDVTTNRVNGDHRQDNNSRGVQKTSNTGVIGILKSIGLLSLFHLTISCSTLFNGYENSGTDGCAISLSIQYLLVFFLLLYSLKKLNNKLHVRLEKATNGVSTADGRTKIPYATRVYELFIID